MTMPIDTFTEKISNLLQRNWDNSSTGLQVTEVFWSHDKFDTMAQVEQVSQKAIISTYNPQNPVTCQVLSRETNMINELVVIDVLLHPAAFETVDQAIGVREKIRTLIQTVIHANWNVLPGAAQMTLEGEYVRGELPQIQRESFKVSVLSFEVAPP